jgi:hypothetical protein
LNKISLRPGPPAPPGPQKRGTGGTRYAASLSKVIFQVPEARSPPHEPRPVRGGPGPGVAWVRGIPPMPRKDCGMDGAPGFLGGRRRVGWGCGLPGPQKRGTGGTRHPAWVRGIPPMPRKDCGMDGAPGFVAGWRRVGWGCGLPGPQKRGISTPRTKTCPRGPRTGGARLGIVVSHPSGKNKDAARVGPESGQALGHPAKRPRRTPPRQRRSRVGADKCSE